MSSKTEWSKIINLLIEFDFFQVEIKQTISDIRDYEFLVTQVLQQFEDIDSQFTDLKSQEMQERIKLVAVEPPLQEIQNMTEQINGWKQSIQNFKQQKTQPKKLIGKQALEQIDSCDLDCDISLDQVQKASKEFFRIG